MTAGASNRIDPISPAHASFVFIYFYIYLSGIYPANMARAISLYTHQQARNGITKAPQLY